VISSNAEDYEQSMNQNFITCFKYNIGCLATVTIAPEPFKAQDPLLGYVDVLGD
jgi:hypothetical protein